MSYDPDRHDLDSYHRTVKQHGRAAQPAAAEALQRRREQRVLTAAEANPGDAHLDEVAGSIRDHRAARAREREQ